MSNPNCRTAQNFCLNCQTAAQAIGRNELLKDLPSTGDYVLPDLFSTVKATLQKIHDYGAKGNREWPSQREINSIPKPTSGNVISVDEYNQLLKVIAVNPITVSTYTHTDTVTTPGQYIPITCPDLVTLILGPQYVQKPGVTNIYTSTMKNQKKSDVQLQVHPNDIIGRDPETKINILESIKSYLLKYNIDYNRCNDCNTSNNCAQCDCDCHRPISICDICDGGGGGGGGGGDCCMYGGTNASAGCHTCSSGNVSYQ